MPIVRNKTVPSMQHHLHCTTTCFRRVYSIAAWLDLCALNTPWAGQSFSKRAFLWGGHINPDSVLPHAPWTPWKPKEKVRKARLQNANFSVATLGRGKHSGDNIDRPTETLWNPWAALFCQLVSLQASTIFKLFGPTWDNLSARSPRSIFQFQEHVNPTKSG